MKDRAYLKSLFVAALSSLVFVSAGVFAEDSTDNAMDQKQDESSMSTANDNEPSSVTQDTDADSSASSDSSFGQDGPEADVADEEDAD